MSKVLASALMLAVLFTLIVIPTLNSVYADDKSDEKNKCNQNPSFHKYDKDCNGDKNSDDHHGHGEDNKDGKGKGNNDHSTDKGKSSSEDDHSKRR